jgi:hypothetical protein
MEDYEKYQKKYGQECKEELEKDPNFKLKVTEEQAVIILEPCHAPENFYCDGEITPRQALINWKRRLNESGLNPYHVSMIKKYIFD